MHCCFVCFSLTSMVLWFGYVICKCSVVLWFGYVICKCSMVLWFGYVICKYSMVLWFGYVIYKCCSFCAELFFGNKYILFLHLYLFMLNFVVQKYFLSPYKLVCTKYLAFSKNAEETAVAGDACWCCIYRRGCWRSCRDRANSSAMTHWSNNELSTNTCRQLRQCAKCVPKHHISTVITCMCARV